MGNNLRTIFCDSRSVSLFYLAAVAAPLAAIVLVVGITLGFDVLQSRGPGYVQLQTAIGIVGVILALSILTVFYGMLLYLLSVDQKSWKPGWILFFFLSGGVGPVVYFFVVYSKQVAVHDPAEVAARGNGRR